MPSWGWTVLQWTAAIAVMAVAAAEVASDNITFTLNRP